MGHRLTPRQSAHYCVGLVLTLVPLAMASTASTPDAELTGAEQSSAARAAEPSSPGDPVAALALSRSSNRFDTLPVATVPLRSDSAGSGDLEVSSAKGTQVWTASAMSDHNVPAAAERAYRRAARTTAETDPTCQLPWTLLAGIGRVESDHGRYGGSVLGTDGVPRPRIIGVQLNGAGPVAAIRDTDDGKLDGDKVWDRAVGPMQFIPSTWAGAARDGDGDGTASPDDLDDAALAAATYLCSGSGSVLGESAMSAAIYRYNQDDYYVALVMAFERGYRTGEFIMPPPPEPEEDGKKKRKKRAKDADGDRREADRGGREQVRRADRPSDEPSGSRDREQNRATEGTSAGPDPSPSPKPSPRPKPSASPTPSPSRSPSPSPSPSESPSDDAEQEPELERVSGSLAACSAESGWCVDGTALELGPKSQLGRTAAADYSGDQKTGTNAQELEAISASGKGIELVVEMKAGAAVVYLINGEDYRYGDGSYA